MKVFTISSILAILAASSAAAPAEDVEARQFKAHLTFIGGTPKATYVVDAATDGSFFHISESNHSVLGSVDEANTTKGNDLSVSHIKSEGGATCTIYGSKGSKTTLVGAQTVDVGPPQPQVSGACLAL